ncbi:MULTISPECIES: chromosome segregation protein SMC [Halobacterium]|uniref:chromosome segregation protein SMC n=1 Tax=Halobacterium TaxID=2239 RepID=UPI0019626F88|nr:MULTISPECIES: chromosome segregation protein SMC [Halobacterium]MDL0121471.1 chromosome segregation protein SMC [Halobacterium salinarum]MDL0133088.1 chromosome segregation protein SMC [Halobacterium salinarum]QRY25057.1 chromosome segregation protein SMC [Halobacterium sp. BOL4-2]
MYIEELVVENFKSFAGTTRIPFYEDFTTISGPNGSGKSNIIDAILFALGLARTTGMRAETLTDLIYNPAHEGADGAAGPTEASVEVVLNNDAGVVSRSQVTTAAGSENVGSVDTITIKRRVKRTDDSHYSYYYLNDRSVNLADIQELLAQAGIAPEGYNVVMQGDVTGIINMTAGERREIIDEIAGVAEFDAKKRDAFEELDVVEERIGEAELKIDEKRDRLDRLADERETALEYQDLQEEKQEYEGYAKAAELEERRADLSSTRADIDEQERELEGLTAELDERRDTVGRIEADLAALNAEIERKGEDEQLAIKREIEEIKGEVSRLEDTVAACEDRVQDADAERREAVVEIDRKRERIDALETDIREVKVQKASVTAEIQERRDELADIEAEIESVDTEFDELKAALADEKTALEDAKRERNDHQREQDRLLDEAKRRSEELADAEADLEDARAELPEVDATLDELADELEKATRNREQIVDVVEDLKQEKRQRQEDLAAVEDELSAAQEEYARLEAQADQSGDSSYGKAVTTVLNDDRDGVHGTVGQLGGVREQYATACETAAGGRLANVVVDDDGVGQRCIEYLKQRNAGRATFLPITEMQQRSLPSAPAMPGVVDFAYDLVDFDERYAPVFSYVLGSTLVVENMETARDLMGEFRLVTLAGDLVEKSGAMTGGSRSGSRYSFSKSGKGQLERVAERIQGLEDDREDCRQEVREIDQRLDSARDRRQDATEQVRTIQADIEAAEADREAAVERIADLETRIEELQDEREAVDAEMQTVDAEIDAQQETIAAIEAEIESLEAELAESRIPELTAEKEDIEATVADLEGRVDELDGELNSLTLEKEYAEDAVEDLQADVADAESRKADEQARIEALNGDIEAKQAELAEKEAAVEDLEAELADLKRDREERKADLSEAEDARDEQAAAVEDARHRLERLQAAAQTLSEEVAELDDAVGEYDPAEIPDADVVAENVERLGARMEALEPVNMLAIDEYESVADTLDSLEAQRATLTEEADGIRERIARYDEQKKSTFMAAFEAINDHFQRIFSRLSAGTGGLELETPDDPFDGGLTMKAQPGDKPVQRLDAMSGGEKSLTALAFIFAIQRHTPAPFYALDEVDAFLDAVNADRVGELVDELAGDAQFVVVSHRSAMLDRSERAIGVTMQADNRSIVTGIDLSAQGAVTDD